MPKSLYPANGKFLEDAKENLEHYLAALAAKLAEFRLKIASD
jgi:hypothetical protein